MEIISLLWVLNALWQDKISQRGGRREASLEWIQERIEEEKFTADIDTFYFWVLCKGDQRNEVADGGEMESQEIFLNVAYIMACAHGEGRELVLSTGIKSWISIPIPNLFLGLQIQRANCLHLSLEKEGISRWLCPNMNSQFHLFLLLALRPSSHPWKSALSWKEHFHSQNVQAKMPIMTIDSSLFLQTP